MTQFQRKTKNKMRWLLMLFMLLILAGTVLFVLREQVVEKPPAEDLSQEKAKADGLLSSGRELGSAETLQETLDQLEQALAIYTEIGDSDGRSEALFTIAAIKEGLRHDSEAVTAYQEAAKAFRESANPEGEATSYLALSEIYLKQRAYEQVLDYSRELLRAALAANAPDGQAAAYFYMGIAYYALGDTRIARERFQVAQVLYRNAGDSEGEARSKRWIDATYDTPSGELPRGYETPPGESPTATTSSQLSEQANQTMLEGIALFNAGKVVEAISIFEQSLTLFRDAGDAVGEASALNALGAALEQAGDPEQALERLTQALTLVGTTGDTTLKNRILGNIAHLYERQTDFAQAQAYYNEALNLARLSNDRESEAHLLMSLGRVFAAMNKYESALSRFEQALPLMRANGDVSGELSALIRMGKTHHLSGAFPQAIEYYDRALVLARQRSDRSNQGAILQAMGISYIELGQFGNALESLHTASEIAKETGDPTDDLEVYFLAATAQEKSRNYEAALIHYERVLQTLQTVDDPLTEATTLEAMARIYARLGQIEEGLVYYERAQSIFHDVGIWQAEVRLLAEIGAVHQEKGDLAAARAALEQALQTVPPGEDVFQIPDLLLNLGSLMIETGDYDKGVPLLERALQAFRNTDDQRGIGFTLNNIGAVLLELGEYQQARVWLEEGLEAARRAGDWQLEKKLLTNLGNLYLRQGQNSEAARYYEQAIDTLSDVMEGLMIKDFRASFLGSNIGPYKGVVLALSRLDRQVEAYEYVQQAKARVFVDQVLNEVFFTQTEHAQQFQRKEDLRLAIAELEAQIKATKDPSLQAALQNEVDAKRRELFQWLRSRFRVTPTEPLTLAQVQAALDEHTTLVEYFVTFEQTLVFIVTRDSLVLITLSVSEGELATQVKAFLDFPNLSVAYPQSLVQLYEWLIEPIEPYLKTPIIGIVPHGKLHYLPFTALTDGVDYLSENYTLFTLPSASILSRIQSKPDIGESDPILILGASAVPGLEPLRFAAKEAQAVAELYGTRAYIGDEATESWLKDNSADYRILHLAAHGQLDADNPLLSSIRFMKDNRNDGYLYIFEVFELNLRTNTDLVVLSACETNVGDRSDGDDFVGLSQAFIETGAPTVIASLWSVNDRPTAELMSYFYTFLQKGWGKAAALQAAQAEMRTAYPNPYYWAAFVLIGDPG
jgi:CHAT domain-containing protein/tetratricopeptide (TPR) repeat protein